MEIPTSEVLGKITGSFVVLSKEKKEIKNCHFSKYFHCEKTKL